LGQKLKNTNLKTENKDNFLVENFIIKCYTVDQNFGKKKNVSRTSTSLSINKN
jgi:hypothetical protein